MTRVLASLSAPSSAFADGFGRRVRGIDADAGDEVDLLELEPWLVEHDSFVAALAERVARVSSVRHASYVHLRRLDRPAPDRLTLVSDHTPGWRLSDLLRMGVETGTVLDTTVVIGLLRQLLPAVSLFSRHNRDSAIGGLAPERLIVTPQARLVIPEHAFGSALEKLNLGRDRFWREFRIAMPPSAGLPRANARADATALGVIALSLVLGRNLEEPEYPGALEGLIESATERRKGESTPLSAPFAQWLARALQFEVRNAFQTPHEAQVAFEAVLASNRGYVTTPAPLDQWVTELGAALDAANAPPEPEPELSEPEPLPVPESRPIEPPLPAFVAEMPALVLEASVPMQDAPEAEPEPPAEDESWIPEAAAHWTATAIAPPVPPVAEEQGPSQPIDPVETPVVAEAPAADAIAVVEVPETPASDTANAFPVAAVGVTDPLSALAAHDGPVATDAMDAPVEAETPSAIDAPPSLDAPVTFDAPAALDAPATLAASESFSTFRSPLVQGLVGAVVVLLAALGWLLTRPSAGLMTGEGELVVQSRPIAKLSLDGKPHGVTPQTLRLSAGAHVLEVQVGTSEPRVIPLSIRTGVQTSQYIELQNVPLTGGVDIKTDPVGARVTVDGQARGTTPTSIKDLTPGDHELLFEINGRKARHVVHIETGITAQVVVPIPKK